MVAEHRSGALSVLITAMPPSTAPGAVPSAPAARVLARVLRDGGHGVRVLVPEAEASGWPDGVEVVRGSVTEPAAVPGAFRGVDTVFLAGLAATVPKTLRELTNLLVRDGLRRAVVLSSHGPDFESAYSVQTWPWLAFERALQLAGAEWTYVRPAGLFGNALVGGYPISGAHWARHIRSGGPVREFRPEVRYPFMDEDDLADVAAEIVRNGGFAGEKLDVVGTLVSAQERLMLLNDAVGLRVDLDVLADDERATAYWRAGGWPDITIEVTLFAMKAFAGSSEARRQIVDHIHRTEAILGRPTRSFGDWVTRHAAEFVRTGG